MPVAVQILQRLELEPDCELRRGDWQGPEYGKLVEVGAPVRVGDIAFTIMCSYEDIFIQRVSGNKDEFYQLCESIRDMEFNET